MKLPILQMKLGLAMSLVSFGLIIVQTQPVKSVIPTPSPTSNSNKQFNQPLIFEAPPPPEGIDAPGGRTAGGKRGCENIDTQFPNNTKNQLTALVPIYQIKDSELVLGFTTTDHPTFWFYVPYSSKLNAEFVLQDATQQTIYQTPVSLSPTPGILSLSLLSNAAHLEIGKRYHWYFSVYCQSQQPPVFVDGWIQRTSLNPTLKTQLQKATPQQRIRLYASNGIWYDALTASAELCRTDPKRTDWIALLQAVDLADIALQPLKC
jgi:hypothetical protein